MTVRSVILGLLGATVILAFGFIIGHILQLASFTSGGLLPLGVMVPMMVGAVVIALGRLCRIGRRFSPGELVVIVAILATACSVLAGGVQTTLTPALAMPMHYNRLLPGWKKNGLMGYVPPSMLPADAKYDAEVLEGFLSGLGDEGRYIPLSAVPWSKWAACLTTWLPLIALAGICMTCMALMVHRQWSQRERLRYPIAEFATTMLSGRAGAARKPVYTDSMFLTGLGVVFAIVAINGLRRWFPGSISIPMVFNLNEMSQIAQKWPIFTKAPFADHLLEVRIDFIAIAFSFFLASDVSLSLGLSQAIFVPIGMWMLTMGVDLKSSFMEGGGTAWQRFGSYLAFGLMLLYFGRRFYWQMLLEAVTFRRRQRVASYEAWACRWFLLAAGAMFVIVWRLGLDWTLALLTVGMVLLLYLIVARIAAETGLFAIQARWQPLGIFLGLLGAYALGPKAIIIVGILCAALTVAVGGKLMSFLVNILKIGSDLSVKAKRLGLTSAAVYVVGVALAFVVALWATYNFGVTRSYDHTVRPPTMAFQPADMAVTKMKITDELEASEGLSPLQRLTNLRPKRMFLWAAGIGFAAVVLFSALRLRFPWWPLHPVMFLVWATWPMGQLSHSFFIGWFIRSLVIRLGGYQVYQRAKLFMVGAIAGNLLGLGMWMIVGIVYYLLTGLLPPR